MRLSNRGAWLLAVVVPALALPAAANGQGMFGGRSIGEAIGDGRKGPQFFQRPTESYSEVAVLTRPSINPLDGSINAGTTSGGRNGPRVAGWSAQLYKAADGRWWWTSNYSDGGGPAGAVPAAEQVQRAKAREEQMAEVARRAQVEQTMNFRIDPQGLAFSGASYLGQGRRVVNQATGRAAWRFDIPNGWTLVRYDGENATTRHNDAK